MNRVNLAYVGQRASVQKRYERRAYTFRVGKPTSVPASMAEGLLKSDSFVLADEAGRTVEDSFPNGGVIVLRRWGALGDIIMLRAVVSAFRRLVPSLLPVLRCSHQWHSLFAHDDCWYGVDSPAKPDHEANAARVGLVNMDQVAEADHRGSELSRVELFMAAMTSRAIEILPEDWALKVPPEAVKFVASFLHFRNLQRPMSGAPRPANRKLIAVQLRGSGPMKSLPKPQVASLIRLLKPMGDIVLIESDEKLAREYAGPGVHAMPGRDALHTVELLRHVDLAVTMDSGPLWLAHAAACPTLCIMGPTRPAQRITFHPLYASGQVRAVSLNEIISCPACFEQAKACKGAFACMQKQPDWAVALQAIVSAAESILAGDRALPLAMEPARAAPAEKATDADLPTESDVEDGADDE